MDYDGPNRYWAKHSRNRADYQEKMWRFKGWLEKRRQELTSDAANDPKEGIEQKAREVK